MKKILLTAGLIFGMFFVSWAEDEDPVPPAYLWWTIEDDPTVTINPGSANSYDTSSTLLWMNTEEYGRLFVSEARVHVTGNGTDQYLSIIFDGDDPSIPDNHLQAYSFDDGYLPPDDPIGMGDTQLFAFDVSSFRDKHGDLIEGYQFAIEIGNWVDYEDDETWVVMAEHYIPDEALASNVVSDPLNHPTEGWYPVDHFNAVGEAVPEPTSGMLVIFGFGFLALRRRNARKPA